MKSSPRKFQLTADILLRAYSIGVFPMAESRQAAELFWLEPQERGVFPLDKLILSRSLAKTVRSNRFRVVADHDFPTVMRACAERENTWINDEILRLYCCLFDAGHAHSIEVYEAGTLVGGLHGVSLRGAFFGESMFHRARDASKVALVHLFARLLQGGFSLLDTQFLTEHLASLGAVAISRESFRALLAKAMAGEGDFAAWPPRSQRCLARGRLNLLVGAARKLRSWNAIWRGDLRFSMNGLQSMAGVERLTRWVFRRTSAGALPEWRAGSATTPAELLASRRAQAEYMFRRIGITFGVYGDKDAAERLIPFDIVPRLISRAEWTQAGGRAHPAGDAP